MKTRLWLGRLLSALPVLVLLMSATMKFVRPAGFDDGLAHMGLPLAVVPGKRQRGRVKSIDDTAFFDALPEAELAAWEGRGL